MDFIRLHKNLRFLGKLLVLGATPQVQQDNIFYSSLASSPINLKHPPFFYPLKHPHLCSHFTASRRKKKNRTCGFFPPAKIAIYHLFSQIIFRNKRAKSKRLIFHFKKKNKEVTLLINLQRNKIRIFGNSIQLLFVLSKEKKIIKTRPSVFTSHDTIQLKSGEKIYLIICLQISNKLYVIILVNKKFELLVRNAYHLNSQLTYNYKSAKETNDISIYNNHHPKSG